MKKDLVLIAAVLFVVGLSLLALDHFFALGITHDHSEKSAPEQHSGHGGHEPLASREHLVGEYSGYEVLGTNSYLRPQGPYAEYHVLMHGEDHKSAFENTLRSIARAEPEEDVVLIDVYFYQARAKFESGKGEQYAAAYVKPDGKYDVAFWIDRESQTGSL